MKILFLTREPAVCLQIAERMPPDDYRCVVTDNTLFFYDELLRKKKRFDLLVCDYRQFQHNVFNIYQFLLEKKVLLPVIFYNDPYPDTVNRTLYWIAQNEEQFSGNSFDYLRPVLDCISAIIEDPSVHPYISLLQPPLYLSDHDGMKKTVVPEFDLELFRQRNKLTPILYKLFVYLYKHRNREISVSDIERQIWGRKKNGLFWKNSVYSYISRLRKSIANDLFVRIDIMRTSPGNYKMIIL